MTIKEHLAELPEADRKAFGAIVEGLQELSRPEPSAAMARKIHSAAAACDDRCAFRSGHLAAKIFAPSWWILGSAAAVLVLGFVASSLLDSLKVESAARGGNQWLAQTQEPDGTWTPSRFGGLDSYRPSISAICTLALARDASNPEAVRKSLLALMEYLERAQPVAGRRDSCNATLSAYALALLAPAEDARVAAVLEREVARLASSQSATGGWNGGDEDCDGETMTFLNAEVLALAEKRGVAGAKVPLRKARRRLRDIAGGSGTKGEMQSGKPDRLLLAGLPYDAGARVGGRLYTASLCALGGRR